MEEQAKRYSFEKVICPKCGKAYAVTKGTKPQFACSRRDCREQINVAATKKQD